MVKRKHRHPKLRDPRRRVVLIARIAVVYVIMAAGAAWAAGYFQVPLYEGAAARPTVWLWSIWTVYYLAPFGFAALYGFLFRPFWAGFRDFLLTILALQLLYSFSINMLRWEYLQKARVQGRWSQNDKLKIAAFQNRYLDQNQDGLKDELQVRVTCDLTRIRRGEYLIDAAVVPGGANSPLVLEGGGMVKVEARGEKNMFVQTFSVRPQGGLAPAIGHDLHFQLKFILSRIISVDDRGTWLRQLGRWSPYFRTTGWDGSDPAISDNWIVLESVTRPEVFLLRVPEEQRE